VANREEAGAAGPRAKVDGQLSLGVDALGTAGLGPGPALGAGVDVGLRRRRWSLELDARAVMPSSADLAGGTVTAWLGMLALAPCGHFHAFAACAVGGVGALRSRGEGFVLTGNDLRKLDQRVQIRAAFPTTAAKLLAEINRLCMPVTLDAILAESRAVAALDPSSAFRYFPGGRADAPAACRAGDVARLQFALLYTASLMSPLSSGSSSVKPDEVTVNWAGSP